MSYNVKEVTFRQTACCAIHAERKAGQTKNELFWHARRCIAECEGDSAKGLSLFLVRCLEQETWMTSAVAGQMRVESVPALWQQGKSDIKRSIEGGLDIRNYESYHAMRSAKVERNKQKQKAEAVGKPASPDDKVVRSVEDALESGEVVDAKNTTICPEDLLPIVALLKPLNELTRQRAISKMFTIATEANQLHNRNAAEGSKRRNQAA